MIVPAAHETIDQWVAEQMRNPGRRRPLRVEEKLMIHLEVCAAEIARSAAGRMEIGALADIMTRTLPEGGMDRMTSAQVEELLAVSALTAHL